MSSSSATATSSRQPARSGAASGGWSVADLRAVWARQQGQVSERIGVLESALAALADDRLEADLRCEAERAAHTLAGSLGMFGFVGAADAARKLEQALATPAPQCAPGLCELLGQLQAEVHGPVVLDSDIEEAIPARGYEGRSGSAPARASRSTPARAASPAPELHHAGEQLQAP